MNFITKPDISFIILVFNEEKTIGILLDLLAKLRNNYNIEIIVIDSGSYDKSIPIVLQKKEYVPEIKFYSIKQNEFNYAGTRNKAINLASGKYICFISADALPINLNFLNFFLSDLKSHKKAVAVYGQQIPYKHTPLFINTEISCLFDKLNKHVNKEGVFIQKKNNLSNDPVFYAWFLSNVFACYKKSYLKKYPFPKTNNGAEDIKWAKMMIQKGYGIIYDSRCLVFHSHKLNFREYFLKQKRDIELRQKHGQIKTNIWCKIRKALTSNDELIRKAFFLIDFFLCYATKITTLLYINISRKWKNF